jgi:hypothetical protein
MQQGIVMNDCKNKLMIENDCIAKAESDMGKNDQV